MKKDFPCIKVSQPIGDFYLASIPASILKDICFSRVASYEDGSVQGNQRLIDTRRSKEIQKFLTTESATIPNTIILGANYDENDNLILDPESRWEYDSDQKVIYIPLSKVKSCSIIDGQHRLEGFKGLNLDMQIPCSIYIDLPPSMQAYIFATINFNQKKVDKSLAYQLFGYQMDDSNSDLWSPDIVAVKLSRYFHANGPFKGRIRIIQGEGGGHWTISSASFIEGVLSLISGNPKNDKYLVSRKGVISYQGRKALDDNGSYPLRRFYLSGNDKAIEMIIERFFSAMNEILWKDQPEGSILFRTVGIAAQFRFLKYILCTNAVTLDAGLDFHNVLSPLSGARFDDAIFSARTATIKLILDAMKFVCRTRVDCNLDEIDGRIKNIFN